MKTTYQTGLTGEKTAAEWLQGTYRMQLIETRYRNKAGEIDLIMLDQNTIVFIEVKTRSKDTYGNPAEAVDRNKKSVTQ